MDSSSAPISIQLISWLYFLAIVGFFGFFIYCVNSIRKSQRNISATLEKLLDYLQEKDTKDTKK